MRGLSRSRATFVLSRNSAAVSLDNGVPDSFLDDIEEEMLGLPAADAKATAAAVAATPQAVMVHFSSEGKKVGRTL